MSHNCFIKAVQTNPLAYPLILLVAVATIKVLILGTLATLLDCSPFDTWPSRHMSD